MYKLVKYPDELLNKKCEEVKVFSPDLDELLNSMKTIMLENNGMGIAANQVGSDKRIFLMNTKQGIYEFINPKIVSREGTQFIEEGCLSAPGVFLQIPRTEQIIVEAQDRTGTIFTILAVDLEAVCIQHEIDHLDGVFYFEKVNRQQRKFALKQLGL